MPKEIWDEIFMDFVTSLPSLGGKSVTLVIVERHFKHSHFAALAHPLTVHLVAQSFMDIVAKHHGLP